MIHNDLGQTNEVALSKLHEHHDEYYDFGKFGVIPITYSIQDNEYVLTLEPLEHIYATFTFMRNAKKTNIETL